MKEQICPKCEHELTYIQRVGYFCYNERCGNNCLCLSVDSPQPEGCCGICCVSSTRCWCNDTTTTSCNCNCHQPKGKEWVKCENCPERRERLYQVCDRCFQRLSPFQSKLEPTPEKPKWEDEFDKLCGEAYCAGYTEPLKSFITNLLERQKKEINNTIDKKS